MSYSYDHTAAAQAEERVGTAAANLQGAVDELAEHMRALSAQWQGGEHEDYASLHNRVNHGFESITHVLHQIQATVADNSHSVASMQQRIANTIQNG